jgi:tetratricopeptide (TPR) repeat protein
MLDQADLDALWDFDDPAGSVERFRGALNDPGRPAGELLALRTQLARALGLGGDAVAAHSELDALEATDPPLEVAVRTDLERGRLLNSDGFPEEAEPLFEKAAAAAHDGGLTFLEIDALHMLAIADPARADAWADAARILAEAAPEPRTRRWLVSIHNNRGWTAFDAGRLDEALTEFEAAATAAERYGTEQQRAWAAEALLECRAALGAAR